MEFSENCYFCNIIINNLITFQLDKINSKLVNLSDDNFSFWIVELDKKSCKYCGIKYKSWIKNKNKIKLLCNREVTGKLILSFPVNNVDTCISCNKIFRTVNNIEEKKYKLNGSKYCEYCWNQYISSFSL